MCQDSIPDFLGAHYFLWVTQWSPRRRNVRTNRLCGKHSSTPDPWVPLTVLLYEATGTLQMEKEDHPGLSGWPHLIAGTPTAEGATGGKGVITLKMNWAHVKQKEYGWPLRGELSHGRRASKETGASVPQLQGIISDNTQMSLEASSPSERPGRNRNPLSPWFWSCKTSRKASPTTMYSDFWSTELWWNKWALFQVAKCVVIYPHSNKKLICSQIRQCKVKQGGTRAERKTQTSHPNGS